MLRVIKPTSPMSIGTWILSGYAPTALAAGELVAGELLERRLEPVVRRSYEGGRAGTLMRIGKALTAAGAATAQAPAATVEPQWQQLSDLEATNRSAQAVERT